MATRKHTIRTSIAAAITSFALVFGLGSGVAQAATGQLYVDPASLTVDKGQTFAVTVRLTGTETTKVNAQLSINTDKLTFTGHSTSGGSFSSVQVTYAESGSQGEIKIVATGGNNQANRNVVTLSLYAKAPGNTNVNFTGTNQTEEQSCLLNLLGIAVCSPVWQDARTSGGSYKINQATLPDDSPPPSPPSPGPSPSPNPGSPSPSPSPSPTPSGSPSPTPSSGGNRPGGSGPRSQSGSNSTSNGPSDEPIFSQIKLNEDPTKFSISSVVISSVTPDSAVVYWKTSQPAKSYVYYGTDGKTFPDRAVADDNSLVHSVKLTDLLETKQYYVRVESRNDKGEKRFATATFVTESSLFLSANSKLQPQASEGTKFVVGREVIHGIIIVLAALATIGIIALVRIWRSIHEGAIVLANVIAAQHRKLRRFSGLR